MVYRWHLLSAKKGLKIVNKIGFQQEKTLS